MPIAGTQTVIAPIAPTATTDTYPTHEDAYGKGGFVSIATGGSGSATDAQINARVVADRRKTGMLVYDTSTAKYYRCTNGGSGNWVHENFGAGQGTVQSVGLSMPTGFSVSGSPIDQSNPSGTLTVSTSLSGVLKGTGSGIAAAVAGTDYAAASHSQSYTTVNAVPSGQLLGRYSTGSGASQAIVVGSGLNLSAGGTLTSTGLGGTVTSLTAAAPLTGGTITSSGSIGHATSGATAGTYGAAGSVPQLTIDSYGHVTGVSNVAISGFLPTTGGTVTGDVVLSGASSDLTVGGALVVQGNLTVNGTQTVLNSTTLSIDDKNVVLGDVSSPTDTTADGGGVTLKGATDKTLNWVASTGSWTSSENLELTTGKTLRIDGAAVLSKTSLGSSVVGSALTSVGTITLGTWNGTVVASRYGGTGADLNAAAAGTIFKMGASKAFVAAVEGTDYLSSSSLIDGGTY